MWESVHTGGAGAGDAGGVTARRWGVRPRGVPLSVPLRPHFVVGTDARPFLAAVEVAEGDPGVQDVIKRDLCREEGGNVSFSLTVSILFIFSDHISRLLCAFYSHSCLFSFISIHLCVYLLTVHSPVTLLYLTSHHLTPPPSISLFHLTHRS